MIIDTLPDPSKNLKNINIQDNVGKSLIFDSVYDPYK